MATRTRKSIMAAAVLALSFAGCDEQDELRDIERGRDNRPAIDASPPDEAN